MSIGVGFGYNYSVGGIQDAAKRLSDSAQRVAGSGLTQIEGSVNEGESFYTSKDVDIAQEAVTQKIATYHYKANLKALTVQDKLQRDVLDILA